MPFFWGYVSSLEGNDDEFIRPYLMGVVALGSGTDTLRFLWNNSSINLSLSPRKISRRRGHRCPHLVRFAGSTSREKLLTWRIHGTGMFRNLPTWMADFYGKLVGKYIPYMDVMGLFFVLRGKKETQGKNYHVSQKKTKWQVVSSVLLFGFNDLVQTIQLMEVNNGVW